MEAGAIFVGAAMLVAAAPFVIKPLQKGNRNILSEVSLHIVPAAARRSALAALRDLDFDYQTGKISPEDYPGLRTGLVAEAARYIQSPGEGGDQLEALIRARRAAQSKRAACANCGGELTEGSRFCSQCGEPVAQDGCPACGAKVQSDDLFCTACGAKLGVAA